MRLVEIFADRAALVERPPSSRINSGMTPLGLSFKNAGEWCSIFVRSMSLLSKASRFSARQSRTRRDAEDLQA